MVINILDPDQGLDPDPDEHGNRCGSTTLKNIATKLHRTYNTWTGTTVQTRIFDFFSTTCFEHGSTL
jgi:hypothetical protein